MPAGIQLGSTVLRSAVIFALQCRSEIRLVGVSHGEQARRVLAMGWSHLRTKVKKASFAIGEEFEDRLVWWGVFHQPPPTFVGVIGCRRDGRWGDREVSSR